MTNLFKKAAVFADIHFGKKNNERLFNEDCNNFIDFFISEAKKEGVDTIIFLGDWHDNRQSLHVSTLKYSIENLKKLNDNFENVYMIMGNHDIYYKDRRDVNSIIVGDSLDNITIINDFLEVGDCLFCPWLVNEDWTTIKERVKDKSYVFGHFELPHFQMNAMVEMPDHGGLSADYFDEVKYMTFTGHFHKRQVRKKVCYVGSPFPHTYADAWDDERGFMILEWGQEPKFVDFDGPRYRTMSLTELLDDPLGKLPEQSYAKIATDIDLNYEEIHFIKDTFIAQFKARKFDITSGIRDTNDHDFSDQNIDVLSIDQIVIDGLKSIESKTMKTDVLIKLFSDL